MSNRFKRTGSGVWKLTDGDGLGAPAVPAAPQSAPARPAQATPAAGFPKKTATGPLPFGPTGSTPTPAPPAQSRPTPTTGSPAATLANPNRSLPKEPNERAKVFMKLAEADLAAERLPSAESNLRLALTWDPGNEQVGKLLEEVRQKRDEIRRSSNPNKIR